MKEVGLAAVQKQTKKNKQQPSPPSLNLCEKISVFEFRKRSKKL